MIVTLSFKIISGVSQRASNPLIWVRCWWARGSKAGEKLNAIWCRWAPQPTEEPPHYSTRRSSDEIREGRHSSCGGPLTWFPRDFAASGYEGLERCERAPSPTEKEPAGDGDDQINHDAALQQDEKNEVHVAVADFASTWDTLTPFRHLNKRLYGACFHGTLNTTRGSLLLMCRIHFLY